MDPRDFCSFGNAIRDGKRGWFVGQFLDPSTGLRRRHDVELKWETHPPNDTRDSGWSLNRTATTIAILLVGRFELRLRAEGAEKAYTLESAGDYLIIPPGVEHTWHAPQAATVLTVRTPSVADDQEHKPD